MILTDYMQKWLAKFHEYRADKVLAEKCGLEVKDVCVHEYENDFGKDSRPRFEKSKNPKCKKCGEFYR